MDTPKDLVEQGVMDATIFLLVETLPDTSWHYLFEPVTDVLGIGDFSPFTIQMVYNTIITNYSNWVLGVLQVLIDDIEDGFSLDSNKQPKEWVDFNDEFGDCVYVKIHHYISGEDMQKFLGEMIRKEITQHNSWI